MLQAATKQDLEVVISWIATARECELWAGRRVRFPIDASALAEAIGFTTQGALALVIDGRMAAFGQIVVKAAGRAHLARLIVEPAQRGTGVGTALVTALLERARQGGHRLVSLNVDPANTAAIGLYRKMGFADAPRPEDEPDPHGSRYMQRPL